MLSLQAIWSELTSEDAQPPYLLLDAAGFERGFGDIPADIFARLECLFSGDLAEELVDVAPYLGQLSAIDDGSKKVVGELLARQQAIMVQLQDPRVTFAELHRHFRKFNVVYGPEGNPLFFRYYDSRVLLDVLGALDPAQRASFFGPIAWLLVADGADGVARCYRRGDEWIVNR